MKILEDVKSIFDKYDLKPIELPDGVVKFYQHIRENPEIDKLYTTPKTDPYLCKKYADHIPQGWYGFDIGTPIIPEWIDILDEIVELCIKSDTEFQIHQIKLKYGGIRFYVQSSVIEDIFDVEDLIGDKLFDELLIY